MNTYRMRCEDICEAIGLPMPREVIAQSTATFMHKIHTYQSPTQLFNEMRYPIRSCRNARLVPKTVPPTERSRRSLIYAGISLLSKVPKEFFSLNPDAFMLNLKHMKGGLLSKN